MDIESFHREEFIKKGELFLRQGQKNWKTGKVIKGVLRGYVISDDGEEITTHFYQEGDMIFGNYIPDVACSTNIEAIEESVVNAANFNEVMSYVNRNEEITKIMNSAFFKLNTQLQSRLVALSNMKSVEKYRLFLKEYPNLLNRVPLHYIANFLGMTPTQLSRARRELFEQ